MAEELSGAFTFKLGMDASNFKSGASQAATAADKLSTELDDVDKKTGKARDSLGRFVPKAKGAEDAMGKAAGAGRKMGDEVANGAKRGEGPANQLSASAQRLKDRIEAAATGGSSGFRKLGAAANSARPSFFGLQGAARGLNSTFAALGSTLLIGAGFKAAVEDALALDKSMAEVSTLVDTARVPIQKIGADVRAMAAEFGIAGVEANKALYQAISAGVEASKAIGFMKDAALLASAGLATLDQSVDLLTSTLNSYGLSAEKAGAVSDVFFQVVKDGKTTIPELASSVGKITPMAANAGVSVMELGAGIAALTAGGLNTSESITGLQQVLKAFIKPTDQGAAAAARLGFDLSATALASKGLDGVMNDLAGALKTASDQGYDTTEIVAELFGRVEGANAALTLTGKGLDKFNSSLQHNKDSLGASKEASDKMAQSVSGKLGKILVLVKAEAAKFGQQFLTVVGDLIEFGGGIDGVSVTIRGLGLMARGVFTGFITVVKAAFRSGKLLVDNFIGAATIAFNKLKNIWINIKLLKERAIGTDSGVASLTRDLAALNAQTRILENTLAGNLANAQLIDSQSITKALGQLTEANKLLGFGDGTGRAAAISKVKAESAKTAASVEEQLAIDKQKAIENALAAEDRAAAAQRLKEQEEANKASLEAQKEYQKQQQAYERENQRALREVQRSGARSVRGTLSSSLSGAYRLGVREAQPALQQAIAGAMSGITYSDSTLQAGQYATRTTAHEALFSRTATASEKAATIAAQARGLYGFSSGGEVPGSGRGDRVMAKLEPGEFVVRREVAQRNRAELAAMNAGRSARPGRPPVLAAAGRSPGRVPQLAIAAPGSAPRFEGAAAAATVVSFPGQFSGASGTVNNRSSRSSTTNIDRSTADNRTQHVTVQGGLVHVHGQADPQRIADQVERQLMRKSELGLLKLGGRG